MHLKYLHFRQVHKFGTNAAVVYASWKTSSGVDKFLICITNPLQHYAVIPISIEIVGIEIQGFFLFTLSVSTGNLINSFIRFLIALIIFPRRRA